MKRRRFGGHRPLATKTASASPRKLQNYPIRSALPPTAVRVDDKTPLAKGVKLSCNWGSRWEPVTVLDVYDDGAVRIHWDKYGSSWDGDIARDCLIIDKQVLATMPTATSASSTGTPAARTWTDATGQFRIEAILLGVTDSKAKLRRTDGREIEVPVSKLSAADQKVITELQSGQADDPFDP